MANPLQIVPKPEFGEPCNHCGYCCISAPCDFAVAAGVTVGPCSFLEKRGDEFWCGLIRHAGPEHQPFMAFRIGFGVGCDSEMEVA